MNLSTTSNRLMAVPPIAEQGDIVACIEGKCSGIDGLIDRILIGIDRLGEYRSALISAAVTGKIDVRGEV